GKPQDSVDDLFPILRKEWSRGYMAGRLKPSALDQIPADAIPMVEQLVLWFPHDQRLYWLLAELENAVNGYYVPAVKMLEPLRSTMPDQLREHYRVLRTAKEWGEVFKYDVEHKIAADALYYSLGIPVSNSPEDAQVAPLVMMPLPEGSVPLLQALALAVAWDRRNKSPDARRE